MIRSELTLQKAERLEIERFRFAPPMLLCAQRGQHTDAISLKSSLLVKNAAPHRLRTARPFLLPNVSVREDKRLPRHFCKNDFRTAGGHDAVEDRQSPVAQVLRNPNLPRPISTVVSSPRH